jgi:hypothetical protein
VGFKRNQQLSTKGIKAEDHLDEWRSTRAGFSSWFISAGMENMGESERIEHIPEWRGSSDGARLGRFKTVLLKRDPRAQNPLWEPEGGHDDEEPKRSQNWC